MEPVIGADVGGSKCSGRACVLEVLEREKRARTDPRVILTGMAARRLQVSLGFAVISGWCAITLASIGL